MAVETKGKIMQAALKLFSENGFEGCSIREIAMNAGVTHQKITYHFQTKENLFVTVLENAFKDLLSMSAAMIFNPEQQHPIEQFKKHLKKVAVYFFQNPEFIKIIYQESLNDSPRMDKIKPMILAYKNNVTKELVYLREYGFGTNITIEQLILIFSGSFQAQFIHPYMHPSIRQKKAMKKKEIDDYIEALCLVLTKEN